MDYFNVDKASYVALFYTSALAKDKTKNKKTLKLNDTTPFHAKTVPFHSNQNMPTVAQKRRRKKIHHRNKKMKKKKMFKFLKPNKAVVLLQGRFAGHKIVIVFWGFCCFGLVKLFPFLFN